MTASPKDAEPHRRTRRDHSSETAEDYVEAVAQILAERGTLPRRGPGPKLCGQPCNVTRIVQRLKEEKLLESEPYGPIALTALGKKLASSLSNGTIWSIGFYWPLEWTQLLRPSMPRVSSTM